MTFNVTFHRERENLQIEKVVVTSRRGEVHRIRSEFRALHAAINYSQTFDHRDRYIASTNLIY